MSGTTATVPGRHVQPAPPMPIGRPSWAALAIVAVIAIAAGGGIGYSLGGGAAGPLPSATPGATAAATPGATVTPTAAPTPAPDATPAIPDVTHMDALFPGWLPKEIDGVAAQYQPAQPVATMSEPPFGAVLEAICPLGALSASYASVKTATWELVLFNASACPTQTLVDGYSAALAGLGAGSHRHQLDLASADIQVQREGGYGTGPSRYWTAVGTRMWVLVGPLGGADDWAKSDADAARILLGALPQ